MSLGLAKEITEIAATSFSDCPLGKMAEGKTFEKQMSTYDKPLGNDLLYSSYPDRLAQVPLDGPRGHWEGNRGESMYIPSDPDVQKRLSQYDVKGIYYTDGIPDFRPIAHGEVKINFMHDGRRNSSEGMESNFKQATTLEAEKRGCSPREVASDMEKNELTWHECNDGTTCQMIPTELNGYFGHLGGVGEYRAFCREEAEYDAEEDIFDE